MEIINHNVQFTPPQNNSVSNWQQVLLNAYTRFNFLHPLAFSRSPSPEPQVQESHYDVLVVGAGPTGSALAYGLVKAGLSVKIIDKNPTPVQKGHADALQPRVLEILASHGLIDEALKNGNRINSTAIYHPGPDGNIFRAGRISNITAPRGLYPFNLTNHQGATECIFLDAMEKFGVTAERSCAPTSMTVAANTTDPHSYPVTVDLHSEVTERTERIHAKYVVGADGAHSWVRKAMNITSTGDRADRCWGVVDFIPDTNYPDIRCTSQVHSGTGFCLIVPRERDMVRLYIPLDDFEQYVNPETKRVETSRIDPDELLRIAKKAFQPYYMNAPHGYEWFTVYIVGQRVADNFSVSNRVFLAGDACHTHSPKAGQGMNAGINDAHNLAWKLSYVLRGWADPSLLNTYEQERRRFARDLIAFDKKYVAMFEKMAKASSKNEKVDMDDHADMVAAFGLFKSGIGIHYTDSAIVNSRYQSYAKNLIVGRRFPPEHIICAYDDRLVQFQDLIKSDTKFKLLVFTGDLTSEVQRANLKTLTDRLSSSTLLLQQKLANAGTEGSMKMLEVYSIMMGKRGNVNYQDVPAALRYHWTTVFVDDLDISGVHGGQAYKNFGIESSGAIVVVRPDGYVGTVAPLSDVGTILDYFKSFFSGLM